MADYDLAIIGGGLNGVSIARDAAGRGLRVILLEQGDLGAGASSASPRLRRAQPRGPHPCLALLYLMASANPIPVSSGCS